MKNDIQQHQMILDETFSSGAEGWYCPVCGRWLIISWPPNYKKTVLQPGNESVAHIAEKKVPGLNLGISAKAQGID